ncbi:cation/H+ exchanger, Cation/H+ exchanger, CPA1 family [Artemisia annua]|uniref:Cation/H+ exchanger, Cation/H+ exchanger, CPA1 family n=1 Tax=Artemisia annua TaxID=35608 RepID=A0A2U1NUA9_ARTAN|nr:cation/H+ exchanger, Cation/H+ exchanger, CPA1 family [Artemisia annua]
MTVFFIGVLMSHYSWHNMTESSRITTRHVWYAFATLSFIAETFIFLYVGMDAHDCENWKVSTLSIVMLLIALGRVAFVFPLSILSNYMHRSGGESSNISSHHQFHFSVLLSGSVNEAMELIRWREQHDNYWYYSHICMFLVHYILRIRGGNVNPFTYDQVTFVLHFISNVLNSMFQKKMLQEDKLLTSSKHFCKEPHHQESVRNAKAMAAKNGYELDANKEQMYTPCTYLHIILLVSALRYTSITKSFGVSIEIYKHNKEERIARTWGTTAPGLPKVEEVITPAGN